MRIVSKFKDFYDYMTQDHDADLVYVREPMVHDTDYSDLYKPRYKFSRRYWLKERNQHGLIKISSLVFGIYPNVYAQPLAVVHYKNACNVIEKECLILPRLLIDELLKDPDAYQSLIDYCYASITLNAKDHIKKADLHIHDNLKDKLETHMWKTECKEVFHKMQAPVFTEYTYDLFAYGCYWKDFDTIKKAPGFQSSDKITYVSNISFNQLNANILKCWYDELNDLNTYINIENFLWSIKQEPESIPDNSTKIVSHGFDLKTSFRKM